MRESIISLVKYPFGESTTEIGIIINHLRPIVASEIDLMAVY